MPGRLRAVGAPPVEAVPPTKAYDIPGLDYSETLTWKAGKAIPVVDLLARLQKLAAALRNYDEDQILQQAFVKLGADLSNANLLGHKDKGVRALSLVCVVDLLRICAPDAPFQAGQLKDIFTVFISTILPALADPSNAYNKQHGYILSSLTEFKSICLITDVDNPDSLIVPLFSTCFDIVSGSAKGTGEVQLGKTVEYNLNNMLAIVIDEIASLPHDVTDIIISQFLRVDPRTSQNHTARSRKNGGANDGKQENLLLKEYPPAYNMAKAICTSCPEKMTTQISQYFSNIIVDAAAATTSKGVSTHAGRRLSDLDLSEEGEEDLADLSKAHRLIRELWRACPDVLLNVIPQIEAELSAESVPLRVMATQTLGDVAAGIGMTGPPPTGTMDPAAYPLPTIQSAQPDLQSSNRLLMPMSPKPFAAVHSAAWQSFLSRRYDKSAAVRATWATAVGRVLLTSAGGIGLSGTEEEDLLTALAQMLGDADEKVRLTALQVVGCFGYGSVINCLGSAGGISKDGSVLSALANRVRDRKHPVREEAIKVLSCMWGVASRDIEENNDRAVTMLGEAPSRILEAYFTNEADVHALLDKVIFESLLPLSFPPIKGHGDLDPDAVRAKRILTFVRALSERAKQVFFAMQARQVQLVKIISLYLKACEDYNGGVVDGNEDEIKAQLTKIIDAISKSFPEPAKVSADLWKFAKMHDRRNYQLIRFCLGPSYDYRTVIKAIKELTKRIQGGPTSTQSLNETITPLLYKCSLIIYNRSHVPTIMSISRSDENGLGEAAHEVLKQISARNPEVLKTHIQDMCKDLESHAPSASHPEDASAADSLKACAAFARKYPAEVSKDRKFLTALSNFALFGSPRGAKHAVSIVMAVADKKEMYAKEILQKAIKNWKFGAPHFLARLAAISQICLLAPAAANAETDAILQIAVADILPHNRAEAAESNVPWSATPSDETIAKELALKIMVNRCRSEDDKADPAELDRIVEPIYGLLMRLIEKEGEVTPAEDTPKSQRARLRLTAIKYMLKLCSRRRRCEELVTPTMFNTIAWTVLHPPSEVRAGFVGQLKKYLGQGRLNHRWFTILFLLAFEPDAELKTSTVTWLKSRVQYFGRQQQQAKTQGKRVHENVMETIMARFLSLLAHHPDCPEPASETFELDLLDFCKYFVFYLQAVATENNLSLIFHIAQRVKQARDGIAGTDEKSEKLYILSDLAQATIRHYADLMPAHAKGINLLQTWPGKIGLPTSLFNAMKSHEAAVEIAEKNFLPEDTVDELEKVVRACVKGVKIGSHGAKKTADRSKKRKSAELVNVETDEDTERKHPKKAKDITVLPVRRATTETKTPRHKRKSSSELPSSEMPSRKSTRIGSAKGVSYIEEDSEGDVDDVAMAERESLAQKATPAKSKETPQKGVDEEMLKEELETKGRNEDLMNGNEERENTNSKDVFDLDENDEVSASSMPLKEKRRSSARQSWIDIGLNGKGKGSTDGKKEKKAAPGKKMGSRGKANEPAKASATPNVRSTRSMKA